MWLKNAFNEFSLKDIPSILSSDNNGGNDLAHNLQIRDYSKHTNIQYYFITELVEKRGTDNTPY